MAGSTLRRPSPARAFVDAARRATLATTAPDGRPRLVPVCFVVVDGAGADGARIYSPLDAKPKRSADPRDLARVRDLLARPAVSLLVDEWSEDWARLGWVRIDGRADLLDGGPGASPEHAAAVAALLAKYPQYATHGLPGRPLVRVVVERVVAWGGPVSRSRRGTPAASA